VRLSLDSGEARSISGAASQAAKDRFRLNTPLVAIGVKGTDFVTQVSKETIRVTVNQGAIVMAPYDGGCKAEALGVCTTAHAKELTAKMLGQSLVYSLGSAAPTLQTIGKPAQSDASRVLLDRQTREVAERPLASETEAKNPLSAVVATKLIWGRWGKDAIAGDSITVPFLEALKDNEVTVGDGYYFLFREPSKLNVLPSLSTKLDFGLKSSSAYYLTAANEMQPAAVQSGTLGVDFGNKTFATSLSLTTPSTGVQSFTLNGTLNPNTGIFLSNSSVSSGANAASVAGALTLDARQAGFLFRAPIGAGASSGAFSGATLWGR
jgi:hypothetical protein